MDRYTHPGFIVMVHYSDDTFSCSANDGLADAFSTREEAEAAIKKFGSVGVNYKVLEK